jgi:signal-transduction protein with cAMP-binding, CBS, and nucleotidyltransferase domain
VIARIVSSSEEAARVEQVVRFLARISPFRELEASLLEDVALHAETGTYPAGTQILRQAGEPADHLYVIGRGAVELLEEGHVVDVLGEGDLFGLSVFSGVGPAMTVRARDDTECYLIPAEGARAVMGTPAGLASITGQMAHWRDRDVAEQHAHAAGVDDAWLAEIGAAPDASGLAAASRRLPSLVADLLDRHVDAIDVGHVVGMSIDHLTIRLIELFIEDRGAPPAAFAWVALGSAARHEQALTTDQDHAIAYGDDSDVEAIDPYFGRLAGFVTAGLEACGIERCRGDVMAVNPAWRRTRDGWRHRFGQYVTDPNLMGARISGIAFDYRRVMGSVEIESTLDEVIRGAGRDGGFVRRLAATALESGPPVGRHRDIAVPHRGEHAGRVDVKHEGITIVTNLARVFAIVAGVTENRTTERLRSAAEAGVIDGATRDDLVEAFRLLWKIRLERHSGLTARGEPADDFVDPSTLPRVTERALGGSLRAIADAQGTLARRLGLQHHRR